MSNVEKYVNKLQELSRTITDFQKQISSLFGGEFKYSCEEIINSYQSMFDRFCPFKVGDKVQLSKTPKITSEVSWGWLGSKHFLVKGAKAIIKERGYSKDHFVFYVEFDNESWIDSNGVEHLISNKHNFHFSESFLEKGEKS